MSSSLTRRRFVGTVWSAALVAMFVPRNRAWAIAPPAHPTPRPGITGERVLTHAQLADSEEFIPLFDAIREIPQIVDGIRCSCGCASRPKFYSLLSCYEGEGMALHCNACLAHGRLVVRLYNEGKTLDQIRAAVDAKFG